MKKAAAVMSALKKLAAVMTALSLAAVMGCENSVSDTDPPGMRFQAAIDGAQERAVGAQWTAGDAIGISMLASGGTGIVDGASNRQYVTAAGNGSFAPARGVNPISVSGMVEFIAYYPYTRNMEGFRYPVDVSSQTNQEAIDLMTTSERAAADQSTERVSLRFKHRLSGVVLEIEAGENVEVRELAGLQASITGQRVRGWYDINANQLSPSDEEADQSIAFKMEADGQFGEGVILPASGGSGRTMKLTMKTGNAMKITFTKKIADDWEFKPGTRYRFPIKLKRPFPAAPIEEIAAEGGFEGAEEIDDWEDVKVEPDEVSPDGPNLSSVTVTPSYIAVEKGGTQEFSARVNGTEDPPQSVSWSVEGRASSSTSISSYGLLTVAADETAGSLTVRASSTVNSAISGTATVTVTSPEGDNPFAGTWVGSDSYGQGLTLTLGSGTWECVGSSGVSWKGTYTSSGASGTMSVSHIKYSSSAAWTSASGYGNGRVTGNTLTATFIITSEGGASTTATFTRQTVSTPSGGMVAIPGGTFMMGSPDSESGRDSDEGPQHRVTVSGFLMGKYEVTQGEYQAVMGSNPSSFSGDSLPVECVTWYDAINYCNALSQREGLTPAYTVSGEQVTWNRSANGYRLPTEAEWEYACRAGTTTAYYTGNSISTSQANYDLSVGGTTPVGSYAPNAWGLYDMAGNVWEWCWDWYGSYTSGSQTNPGGAVGGADRVLRGGGGWAAAGRAPWLSAGAPKFPAVAGQA